MNCDDFFIWLQHRSKNRSLHDPDVLLHIQECDDCRQLYDMDTCFEACIQQSFSLQKLPAGLAKKINRLIDADFFSKMDSLPDTGAVDSRSAPSPVNGQSQNRHRKK